MPGILYHTIFGEAVLKAAKKRNVVLDKKLFLEGNQIPDTVEPKWKSHWNESSSNPWIKVPNLTIPKELASKGDDACKGLFCHLFLDKYFFEEILIKGFEYDFDNMKVSRNGVTWKESEFWDALHEGYTEINPILIERGLIDLDLIEELDEELPKVEIPEYDFLNNRRAETWKAELYRYLEEAENNKIEYTGRVFSWKKIVNFINEYAEKFVDEIVH